MKALTRGLPAKRFVRKAKARKSSARVAPAGAEAAAVAKATIVDFEGGLRRPY
jgi:hypothetical protein